MIDCKGDDRHECALLPTLLRVAAGEEAALKELYAESARLAHGIARRLLRDDALAEDIVLETYEQVWAQASSFDPSRGSVRGWIALIARSRALNLIKKREQIGRFHCIESVAQELPDRGDARGYGASAHSGEERGHGERSSVEQALAKLPNDQRTAIEAAFYDGLSHTELAKRLCLPLGTVKGRIRLGLARLRQILLTLDETR